MTDAGQGPIDDAPGADPPVDQGAPQPPADDAVAELGDRSPADDPLAPIVTEGEQMPPDGADVDVVTPGQDEAPAGGSSEAAHTEAPPSPTLPVEPPGDSPNAAQVVPPPDGEAPPAEPTPPAADVDGGTSPSADGDQAAPAEQSPAGSPSEAQPVQVQPGASTAGSSPVLPPPPPQLAEIPADAGRIVAGRVQAVRGDDVVVDLDDGRTGVISVRNLGAEGDLASQFPVGSPIEGAVLARSDPQHRVVLSRTWALKKRAWEAVVNAAAENQVLTGRVVSVGGKGLVVDVGVRGFVPASHLELGAVGDLQSYAGAELALRVLDVDADKERLVLSRRSLLLREQRKSSHDVLSSIVAGEVRRGRVTSVSDYGAFVDLGGVSGLVHLSELSWHRVRHPSEVVSVGDEVDVKVLDVKVKKRRVSLSIRQLADDPLSALTPGEIRTGPVTRLVDFGAFVDLDGVEGLVHLSELAEYRVSAPEEVVAPGEEVRVKVLSVDRRRRRVELSIRRAAEYGA